MSRRIACMAAFALIVGMAAACSSRRMSGRGYPLIGHGAYTLVDLHPDEMRGRLTTVNYQQRGLIRLCTPVTFRSGKRKSVTFTVDENGREHVYVRQRTLRDPFWMHLDRYFGDTCPRAEVEALSAIDQKGIRYGRAYEGMTRQGVIFAMGYPPEYATPSLDFDEWRYWRSRGRSVVVHFAESGVVSHIEE